MQTLRIIIWALQATAWKYSQFKNSAEINGFLGIKNYGILSAFQLQASSLL